MRCEKEAQVKLGKILSIPNTFSKIPEVDGFLHDLGPDIVIATDIRLLRKRLAANNNALVVGFHGQYRRVVFFLVHKSNVQVCVFCPDAFFTCFAKTVLILSVASFCMVVHTRALHNLHRSFVGTP